jgi:hypothetical protein
MKIEGGVPMLGTAMPIRERTTCVIPDFAAIEESPKRFPFESVTGIPSCISLKFKRFKKL